MTPSINPQILNPPKPLEIQKSCFVYDVKPNAETPDRFTVTNACPFANKHRGNTTVKIL